MCILEDQEPQDTDPTEQASEPWPMTIVRSYQQVIALYHQRGSPSSNI